MAGAVTSIAPAGRFLASASQDRFVRLHSTFGPPAEAGQQQEQKGAVLEKLYVKVTPTVVAWDGLLEPESEGTANQVDEDDEEGEDDVWAAMEEVDSDSDGEENPRRRKEKKPRAT